MKTLISNSLSTPNFTTSISQFPLLPRKIPIILNFPNRKPLATHRTTVLCSSSACYGGWEDLSSGGDSGESTQLSSLLNSLGIDDKKYVFVYLLGFVCALAVSRIRVSSFFIFPACFLVFAVGFSFGIVNGGNLNELGSLIGSSSKYNKKKRIIDDEVRVSIEKLRDLVDLFDAFDINITNLKSSIKKDVDSNRISRSDLESYVEDVESIGQAAMQAKSMITGCFDNIKIGTSDVSKMSNQKPTERNKEMEWKGFDFSQFISGVREKSFGSKHYKVKDIVKNDSINVEANDHDRVNIPDPVVEDKIIESLSNDDHRSTFHDDIRVENGGKATGRIAKMSFMEMETDAKRSFDKDDYILKDNKMRYMNNRNSVRTWESEDDLLDLDNRIENTIGKDQNFKKINGNHTPKNNLETSENEAYRSNGFASSPSMEISDDMIFNEYVMEANSLLKQARECLRHRGIEGDVENALYKSSELLSKALDMKPMSLLAVGQLGNTYLLHGELKLKLSRKLRALIARRDLKVLETLDNEIEDREKVVDYLIRVCEECEELLVKAGRKYRMALSIDGNDMRALYNWGLALSFRAQLIADIGPEAAFDADKVYMAAIDKFDAMMSKSNTHTPDALFRWGVALQQRSRLRTRNFREKVKLLTQAKRLYEDALLMDSSNPQLREALSTCVSELKYKNYY